MKYPALASFDSLLPTLEDFDAIIDVRSPGEFAEDHIPGAINCPVLDNDEREKVGTLYKQVGSFEAKKIGAALVSKNIAHHIETTFLDQPREWKPLVYCWRGGNRSGAMVHILARIGWRTVQLDGGYREYRRHVNAALEVLPSGFTFSVICGPTGSGKSRLLQTLDELGAQVLDLEKLAAHRGSVLGHLPAEPQPSQKAFESRIWDVLRRFDRSRPIFVESESKKVGALRVPEALMNCMRQSPCTLLAVDRDARVRLLMQDYRHFVEQPELLNRQLECIMPLHGRETISRWHQMALKGDIPALVEQLLERHYDPAYAKSINKNFIQAENAKVCRLEDIAPENFLAVARTLFEGQK